MISTTYTVGDKQYQDWSEAAYTALSTNQPLIKTEVREWEETLSYEILVRKLFLIGGSHTGPSTSREVRERVIRSAIDMGIVLPNLHFNLECSKKVRNTMEGQDFSWLTIPLLKFEPTQFVSSWMSCTAKPALFITVNNEGRVYSIDIVSYKEEDRVNV